MFSLCYNQAMFRFVRNAFFIVAFAVFAAGSTAVNAQVIPPASLTPTAVSACQIDLNWTLGSQPYTQIRSTVRAGCDFAGSSPVTSTQSGVTSYNQTGVVPGTTYCYQARSMPNYNSCLPGGCSLWAPVVSPFAFATTPRITAPVLSGIKPLLTFASATDSGTTVTLRLDPTAVTFSDPNFAFYDFLRDGVAIPNATSVPAYFGGTYITFFRDTNVPAGLHSYQIVAGQGAQGCAVSSARRSAPTPLLYVPTTPGNFTGSYTPGATEGTIGSVDLLWTDGLGPATQRIQLWRLKQGDLDYSFIKNIGLGVQAYQEDPTTLQLDNTYYYKMRACYSNGLSSACSDYTPEVMVAVANGPQEVKARMYYVASGADTADILLSWKNTFPGENYIVQRATNTVSTADGVWGDVGWPSGTSDDPSFIFQYQDKNVPLGNFYRYRVAVNYGGSVGSPVLSSTINTRVTKIFSGQAYNSVGPGYLSLSPLPPRGINRIGIPKAFAQTPIPYSDGGAGWIDFNSELAPGGNARHYSVQVDENGLLSGVAWAGMATDPSGSDDSYRYGWLSFNRDDLFGCPGRAPNISCEARYDAATGKFSGWARFIAFENSGTEAGNYWDGWVSLASFGVNPHPYGFDLVAALGKLQGTAWGGLLGWTSVGLCTDVGHPCDVVVTSRTNTALIRNVRVTEGGTMASRVGSSWCASSSAYIVDWTYTDSVNPLKTVADKVDVEFYPVSGVGKTASGTYTGISALRFEMPMGTSIDKLDYDTNYRARVRAFDAASTAWTAWSNSSTFRTPTHYYPFVDFKSKYNGVNSGQYQFGFDGTSTLDRSSGSYPVDGWVWNWEFGTDATELGTPPFATGDRTPSTNFYQDILHPVTLTVDDGGGGVCSYTRDVSTSTTDFGTSGTIRRIWVEP